MKPHIHLVPLEAYQARYTEFLHAWENEAFGQLFTTETVVPNARVASFNITTGEVLDSVQRPVWALNQIEALLLKAPDLDRIWFSDFYHPGLDALAYSRHRFKAYSFLWAQTFDQFDFTRKFINWMRPWECMAFEIYSKVFVASSLLKDLIVTALPHVEEKVVVSGLPFNHLHVLRQLSNPVLSANREIDVVYTSRFDTEKNPDFFLDLVESMPERVFAVCTGHPSLRGTDEKAVNRARQLSEQGRLRLLEGCSKQTYYGTLLQAKVQFNCSSQDWVSFTLLEGLTFGCLPLYPCHRSFPETLHYAEPHLYEPGEDTAAMMKLEGLLTDPVLAREADMLRSTVLQEHDEALNFIAHTVHSDQS